MAKKKSIILYDGKPEISTSHVGTYWQPRRRHDRWGVIPQGSVRMINIQTFNAVCGYINIPKEWFGRRRSDINIKITAEIS